MIPAKIYLQLRFEILGMVSEIDSPSKQAWRGLPLLDCPNRHVFVKPSKRILENHDVQSFLTTKAYRDIGTFIMQLNISMCPIKSSSGKSELWQLDACINLLEPVRKLQMLLKRCEGIIEQALPDTGPRRFGNLSFRKWYENLESQARDLLQEFLSKSVLDCGKEIDNNISTLDELLPYFLGSFGSSQRLDYGTGHELSFLAFLGGLWKLGFFCQKGHEDESIARNIVIGVFEPYFRVIRRLILTYTLEPAGSHGVWGLDDHSFLPYVFGSSQYSPAINEKDAIPIEGSHPDAPDPNDISNKAVVNRERNHNMFFAAVGFIYDVKTGNFWEHSPMLFDISGVRAGWGKINKGMIKMYNAEVLSKFPVVQHFPFGSLFSWEQDPDIFKTTVQSHRDNKNLISTV